MPALFPTADMDGLSIFKHNFFLPESVIGACFRLGVKVCWQLQGYS